MDFPHISVSKESACNTGDMGLIPSLGRSPGEENGNPLQDSCLGNPVDRGAWRATYSPWGRKRVRYGPAIKQHTTFKKVFMNLLQYCFWFMFCFFFG